MARRDSDGITAKITMMNSVQLVEPTAKVVIRFNLMELIEVLEMSEVIGQSLPHGIAQRAGQLLELFNHQCPLLL